MACGPLLAQPLFENTYSESAAICQLESAGEAYYTMDVINKQCHIYTLDHTLFKTIPIPTPADYYLTDIQYVSEKLFNGDNLIELVYSYTKYVPTTTSYYYTYETRLINENGTVLLTFPGAGYTEVVETAQQGKKFLVYEYNYAVIPYQTSTHVYSLPESATKSADDTYSPIGLGQAFPNPANEHVSIPVVLPSGVTRGTLELFDLNGRKLKTHPVSQTRQNIQITTSDLMPGTYLYHVESNQVRSSSKKLVITD